MRKARLLVPNLYLLCCRRLTAFERASSTKATSPTLGLKITLEAALLSKMPRSRSSSDRGLGRSYASAQSSSSRHGFTPSRLSRPKSNATRASTHSRNDPTQRRVTVNPGPSMKPSATPCSASPAPPAPGVPSRSDSVEELLEHVIVAIDAKEMGNVGCAYYIAREERLLCMEEVPKGGAESIERCQCLTLASSRYKPNLVQ